MLQPHYRTPLKLKQSVIINKLLPNGAGILNAELSLNLLQMSQLKPSFTSSLKLLAGM